MGLSAAASQEAPGRAPTDHDNASEGPAAALRAELGLSSASASEDAPSQASSNTSCRSLPAATPELQSTFVHTHHALLPQVTRDASTGGLLLHTEAAMVGAGATCNSSRHPKGRWWQVNDKDCQKDQNPPHQVHRKANAKGYSTDYAAPCMKTNLLTH